MYDFTPAQASVFTILVYFVYFSTFVAPVIFVITLVFVLARHFILRKKIHPIIIVVLVVTGLLAFTYLILPIINNYKFGNDNKTYLNNLGFTTYLPKNQSVFMETNFFRKPPYIDFRQTKDNQAGGYPMIRAIEYSEGLNEDYHHPNYYFNPPNKCDLKNAESSVKLGAEDSNLPTVGCTVVATTSSGHKIYAPTKDQSQYQYSYLATVIGNTVLIFNYDNSVVKSAAVDPIKRVTEMVDSLVEVDPINIKINEPFN